MKDRDGEDYGDREVMSKPKEGKVCFPFRVKVMGGKYSGYATATARTFSGQQRGDGVVVGKISAEASGPHDEFLNVYSAYVETPGCGIGTRLYEALALSACARGAILRSDTSLTNYSGGFWKKQEAKGRAKFVDGRFVLAHCETKLEAPGRKSLPRKWRRR